MDVHKKLPSIECSQCRTSNVVHLFFWVLLNAFVWLLQEREALLKKIEELERSSVRHSPSDVSWKINYKRHTIFKTPRSTFREPTGSPETPSIIINNGVLLSEVAQSTESPEEESSVLNSENNAITFQDSYDMPNDNDSMEGEDVAAKRRQFQSVARELIETEESYIENIRTLQEMFFAPLSDSKSPHSKLISQNDFEKLFRNLNEIYSINTEFLKDLKQAAELQETPNSNTSRQTIGQVFLMYSEYFKAYGLYCAGHNAALATLKKLERSKQFTQFCRSVSVQPRCRKLTLESFLSMPVSRICKYGLLLRELLKGLPSSSENNENDLQEVLLRKALEKISAVVSIVNQRNQHLERIQKVISIADSMDGLTFQLLNPSRVFFFEGFLSFFDIKAQRIKPMTVFLFNEYGCVWFFLISSIILLARRGLRKGRLRYKTHLDFNDCILKDLPDTNVTNAFQLISIKTKLIVILGAETPEQKSQWINLIVDRIQAIAHRNKVIAAKTDRKNSDAHPTSPQDAHYTEDRSAVDEQMLINKKIQDMLAREGYLEKLHRMSWKKRYFVLKDGVLYRYDTRGGKIKGKTDICGKCTIEEHLPEKYNFCFEIKTEHKSIVLRAPTDLCMHEWLNSFLKQKLLADSSVVKTLERLQKDFSPQDNSVYTPVPNFQIMA